jgi:hypothetical protein
MTKRRDENDKIQSYFLKTDDLNLDFNTQKEIKKLILCKYPNYEDPRRLPQCLAI